MAGIIAGVIVVGVILLFCCCFCCIPVVCMNLTECCFGLPCCSRARNIDRYYKCWVNCCGGMLQVGTLVLCCGCLRKPKPKQKGPAATAGRGMSSGELRAWEQQYGAVAMPLPARRAPAARSPGDTPPLPSYAPQPQPARASSPPLRPKPPASPRRATPRTAAAATHTPVTAPASAALSLDALPSSSMAPASAALSLDALPSSSMAPASAALSLDALPSSSMGSPPSLGGPLELSTPASLSPGESPSRIFLQVPQPHGSAPLRLTPEAVAESRARVVSAMAGLQRARSLVGLQAALSARGVVGPDPPKPQEVVGFPVAPAGASPPPQAASAAAAPPAASPRTPHTGRASNPLFPGTVSGLTPPQLGAASGGSVPRASAATLTPPPASGSSPRSSFTPARVPRCQA